MFILNKRVEGVSQDLKDLFEKVSPSTIGHMTDFGFIKDLQPIFRPIKFVGNAVTVRIPHLDSTAVHKVFDIVMPGDVVCVDMSGDTDRSCWGEMVSYMARARGVAGAVIDGKMTDFRALQEIHVPIFGRGISPLTTRILGIEGAINVPISVAGVAIHPGDLVVADDDGVFIIDPITAKELGMRAISAQNDEIETKKKIDKGISLASISGAEKFFSLIGEKS